MLELRRLKYMSVPAEELHFGKVAERLGIAQPALTQHVQALERELGVELFHRTKRSVKLTVAGRVTLNEAVRTLQQAEKTRAGGASGRSWRTGTYRNWICKLAACRR